MTTAGITNRMQSPAVITPPPVKRGLVPTEDSGEVPVIHSRFVLTPMARRRSYGREAKP